MPLFCVLPSCSPAKSPAKVTKSYVRNVEAERRSRGLGQRREACAAAPQTPARLCRNGRWILCDSYHSAQQGLRPFLTAGGCRLASLNVLDDYREDWGACLSAASQLANWLVRTFSKIVIFCVLNRVIGAIFRILMAGPESFTSCLDCCCLHPSICWRRSRADNQSPLSGIIPKRLWSFRLNC